MAHESQLEPRKDAKGDNPGRRFGNEVDDASADSFPASDPPSFSPITSIAPPPTSEEREEREEREADEERKRAREEHAKQ